MSLDSKRWLSLEQPTEVARTEVETKLLNIQLDRDRESAQRGNYKLLAELTGITPRQAHAFIEGRAIGREAAEAVESWLAA